MSEQTVLPGPANTFNGLHTFDGLPPLSIAAISTTAWPPLVAANRSLVPYRGHCLSRSLRARMRWWASGNGWQWDPRPAALRQVGGCAPPVQVMFSG